MSYEVVLDDFQGPLDLLLHLIKDKQMDLETLEVSTITDQYLAYIDQMSPDQLETMSEYLVMAAQLIEMKSKMLLPNEKVELDDDYQEDRSSISISVRVFILRKCFVDRSSGVIF